ncbi:MAG: glycerate kinase [Bacteroidales bacterium]|nr:glycerate kinase [Bacteroidales bacterium]
MSIMRKVVVASDSFKGSLSSWQVAEAVEKTFHDMMPGCDVVKLAVADGGEGSMDALMTTLNGRSASLMVSDPLGRPVEAEYALIDGLTAVIEMARASGLTLLHPEERNPLLTSTYGTGQLIADALDKGCRRFMICIGGSATNDAGTGMLEALGYRFMDAEGNLLKCCGGVLNRICSVDVLNVHPALKESEFIVACDVDSPFCGHAGAAYVYGPQKGATPEMVEMLDEGMRYFAQIISRVTGVDVTDMPGAGAAGGLGGALKSFLNAQMRRGADMVLDAVDFDMDITDADLVITGEGRIDSQTLTGKLPYVVAERAASRNIPAVALCGCAEVDALPMFRTICPVTPEDMPLSLAMDPLVASMNIQNAVREFLMKNITD